MKSRFIISIIFAVGMLAACASQVPREISDVDRGPSVEAAQADVDRHAGRLVRWGGTIASVVNTEHATIIEVVSRALARGGEPDSGDGTEGRFLASVEGFLDPAIYAKDREITVFGALTSSTQRKIGGYAYLFPVVRVDRYYLWPERTERGRYNARYDGGYYPWWHPWYGYGRFGYPY